MTSRAGRRPARCAKGKGVAASPAALVCVTGMAAARAEQVDACEDDGW